MENKKIDRVVLNLSMDQARELEGFFKYHIESGSMPVSEGIKKIQARISRTIKKRMHLQELHLLPLEDPK